jgi:hypothetical protein
VVNTVENARKSSPHVRGWIVLEAIGGVGASWANPSCVRPVCLAVKQTAAHVNFVVEKLSRD